MGKDSLEQLIAVQLTEVTDKHEQGAVVMMELPTDAYLEVCQTTLKVLIEKGLQGVYISFNRPFKNISSILEQNGVDTTNLIFVDVATSLGDEKSEENTQCVHISKNIGIDELVRAIYTSIQRFADNKKFVYIDSLSTISLYKPLSETLRFSEFLIRAVKNQEIDDVIFNVSIDLAHKKFIEDIALKVDEVITVG